MGGFRWAAMLGLAACGSPPHPHVVAASAQIAGSFDATWTAVVDLFGERGWSIVTIEKASGIIATGWLTVPPAYADCGGAGLESVIETQVTFSVTVRPAGDQATVTLHPKFRQLRTFDNVRRYVTCYSTGEVEGFVQKSAAARVADVATPAPSVAGTATPDPDPTSSDNGRQ